MDLRHVVAVVDESETSREALRVAVALAARTDARVTVMRAIEASKPSISNGQLRRWAETDLATQGLTPPIEFVVVHGLPGVEISRFAEYEHADLIVMARLSCAELARLGGRTTADALVRRSAVPCLLVPGTPALPRRVLAALDGSERGMAVLRAAEGLTKQTGAELKVVTVEAAVPLESAALATAVRNGRSAKLAERVNGALTVRSGAAVEAILEFVDECGADILVVGCHRGGSPGVVESGSTAHRLARAAACAVLTVPL